MKTEYHRYISFAKLFIAFVLISGIITGLFAIETRNRVLEEVSP